MDTNGKASENGEINLTENKRSGEVVVAISGEDILSPKLHTGAAKSMPMSTPSPEIARYASSPNRPLRIPAAEIQTRRKSFARSVYSKPKSRFGEPSPSIDLNMFDEILSFTPLTNTSTRASPNNNITYTTNTLKETIKTMSTTPKTPLMASPGGVGGVDEDEDEEIYKKVSIQNKLKYKRVKVKVLVEWIVFLCILGTLIASLTIDKLEYSTICGLEIWKWCVLLMVTICGMLFTKWFMYFVVLLIELNFLLRKKVLYFVNGLKKNVQVCIWWSLVLVTWVSLFDNRDNHGVKRSATVKRILDYVTWTIVSLLIGAFLWLFKTFLLKILAASFHVNTFFDRIQESIFHQYIVLTLSGPPLLESDDMLERTNSSSQLSFRSTKKGKDGKEKEVIDINKLHQMKQEKISAWTMKMLVDVISKSGLYTSSNEFEEGNYDGGGEQADKEITNEMEAIAAAYHIFRNVAQHGCNYIDDMDLRRFTPMEEVNLVLPLIDLVDTGQIDRKSLTEWVVKVYKGRKALAHALNDTKTAVKQLNKLVTVILIVIMIVVWLLLMGIATTKVLVLMSSQLVVAAFMFGNTCKTIFEAIIFVFVMHPFDVGDRCVIDDTQMIVEEMNILTTVFLRYDNEKIFYPNSVLATKPISNFYRSPDMGDSFEFSIDFRTPLEKIGSLREKIQKYIEKNPQYWHPDHTILLKEIEDVNKIKMGLYFSHTMNFQDFGEKMKRRAELVIEMKKIFEELYIKYNLPHQEVHLVKPETTMIETTR